MGIIDYTKEKFELGQEVVLRYEGKKARSGDGHILGNIAKIGRKYLTVTYGDDYKYDIQINLETGYNKTEFSADYQLFPSENELKNNMLREMNVSKISSIFSRWSSGVELSNEQIQRIVNIINE